MRWLGRVPDTHFITFLQVVAADLPVPASKKQSEDPNSSPVTCECDLAGALQGEVYFISRGDLFGGIKKQVDSIRSKVRSSRSPGCSHAQRDQNFRDAQEMAQGLWKRLIEDFHAARATPAFGKATVTLDRTGRCQVDVHPSDLYTTADAKHWQIFGAVHPPPPALYDAAASAGRQVFFFVRDLAHNHYHHDPHSDLMTTAYPWTASEDEVWRRETQYGLARLAIAARRRDTAQSYKQALGLVAYAEAFQKHQCGWRENINREFERSGLAWLYDFAALRLSIEASLKVRELHDSQRLQRGVFAFGFFVTTLGIIISGLRGLKTPPPTAQTFHAGVHWATSHPILSLSLAFTLAQLIWLSLAKTPPGLGAWVGGLNRFIDGLMGSAKAARLPAALAYVWGLFVLALLIACVAMISYFCAKLALERLTGV